MRNIRSIVTLLLVLFLSLVGGTSACSDLSSPPTESTVLQLSWRHSTQFAGFYEAEQDGLYEAEGLVVEFLEGGPEISGLDAVLDGRADIGVAGADELLIARSQGYSVKAIAVVYQISPIVFVSKAELDFTQPQDFVGKKIRVTANLQPTLDAMMSNVGIAQDQYDPIILPSDVDAFASGEVPVWGAYVNGLALQIQQTGIDINIVYPSDYGARFYADTIFTTEEMIEENPEIVEKFLRASLNGWETVIAQPEVVLDTISIYAPDVEPELQRQRMLASIPLIFTGLDPIGSMNLATWSQMGTVLTSQGLLEQPIAYEDVFTMQFLDAILGESR